MIDELKKYIETCPALEGMSVKVDYIDLRQPMAFAIEPLPTMPWVKRYTDGGGVKQYNFAFTTVRDYNVEDAILIENSKFSNKIGKWIEENNLLRVLPEVEGVKPLSISILSSGFLLDADARKGKYQIQFSFKYVV